MDFDDFLKKVEKKFKVQEIEKDKFLITGNNRSYLLSRSETVDFDKFMEFFEKSLPLNQKEKPEDLNYEGLSFIKSKSENLETLSSNRYDFDFSPNKSFSRVGENDLYPTGFSPYGSFFGPNFYSPKGGMFVTEDDELFRSRVDKSKKDDEEPTPDVPPLARFDPFVPSKDKKAGANPDPDNLKKPGKKIAVALIAIIAIIVVIWLGVWAFKKGRSNKPDMNTGKDSNKTKSDSDKKAGDDTTDWNAKKVVSDGKKTVKSRIGA
ncbi:putative PI31 proteasome regulator [Hamiltosporidium tvaerminnensis]|uniref:Putative PI31 proteasome regulator n=1 Tax=Hamiltosporidium tvaerminnensis TaxID=1176355 RepID=A0A4Q9LXI3_9MICR|nr:putative PI31 proteasome regulator [Hamiltosporidium tvaerminnensis]